MSKDSSSSYAETPNQDYVRIIPLGGLEKVGMNCCLVECNGIMVMIDCGLTFPEADGFGVDIILPDWTYALENLDKLDAVILTHGHEDHIGALPFFLHEVDVPVYGGRFTLALLERKLKEHGLDGDVELHTVEAGEVVDLSPFGVEFVHINHSVPNAMSVALMTPLGRLVFTGDWKLDQTPVGEPVLDLQRFAAMGTEGVFALLGDSTNSGTPGFSKSEADVKQGLTKHIENASGRVFLAQFSSNQYRVASILQIAHEQNRKVVLLGRSLLSNFDSACTHGFIKLPAKNLVIDIQEANRLPDNKVLIISTGSQGEPRSSMNRLAYGDNHKTKLRNNDTIILSARRIPGNELRIQNMINQLVKQGATVITPNQYPEVHASGHAKREELKLMINLTQPKHLIPMHGSHSMRSRHAKLGEQAGVPYRHVIEDGQILQLTKQGSAVVGRVKFGRVHIDGRSPGNDVNEAELRDRRKLAQSGIIVVFAVLDRSKRKLRETPKIMQRGFLSSHNTHLLDEVAELTNKAVAQMKSDSSQNPEEVREVIRTTLSRFFRKKLDRRPVVIPIVHDM